MRKFEVKIQKIQENSITISARDKKEALEKTAMEFATKVYEEAAKAAQANENSETNTESKNDDVIDAEFEEGK